MAKLRVAIDFRVEDPRQGVGTAVLALAHGLSGLKGTEQEYIFVVLERNKEFFLPFISGPCSLVGVEDRQGALRGKLKRYAKKIPFLQKAWVALHPGDSLLPSSDGTVETLGCDLVHFPAQTAYTTSLPSIYQPWDLQHCHYPAFFSPEDLRLRGIYYPGFCRRATFVCVQTEWTKQDVVRQLGIPADKIEVVRWGTAFEAYEPASAAETTAIQQRLHLPAKFFLYPAVTWPHKNHEVILRALASLSPEVQVVFTGAATEYKQRLEILAKELGIARQLHFLGFVSNSEIQVAYQSATALVFPSKFEGLGLPVLEAFRVGLPVICASATVLPEVTDGAALLFDPDSPEQLAEHMQRVADQPDLRQHLAQKGYAVLANYSAAGAARQFSKLYEATVLRHKS